MNLAGLSLDRSPPIDLPLRFFLTAPLFGMAAAIVLLLSEPSALFNRWTPGSLALTHLFTLGILGMVMCGALMQLLPVVAGVSVWLTRFSAPLIHLTLVGGTVALVTGLVASSGPWLQAGVWLLAAWGLWTVIAVGVALWRARAAMATVWTMRAALVALVVTVGLGLMLAWGRAHGTFNPLFTDIHAAWGLGGWVVLLVAAVAYQVVPLFQVTPSYPPSMRRFFAPLLLAGLVLLTLGYWLHIAGAARWLLPLAMLLFAGVTLWLQQQRKRKITDASLWFWRLGLGCLMASSLLALAAMAGLAALYPWLVVFAGVLFLFGFAVSLISGMLCKIVPFLVWLHLNNRVFAHGAIGIGVPHMKAVISEQAARRHFYLHLSALSLCLTAVVWPMLFKLPAAIALLLAFGALEWNLLNAVKVYRDTSRAISAAGAGAG